MMRGRWMAGATLIATLAGMARADTLRDAFVQVYTTNPTLSGARAGLRATDEDAAIARAQGLPDLSATGSFNEFLVRSANSFTAPSRSLGAGVTLSVLEQNLPRMRADDRWNAGDRVQIGWLPEHAVVLR